MSVSANAYFMRFHGERIGTGRLNYIGLLLREPVGESARWGLELEARYRRGGLTVSANSALARSRIGSWQDEAGTVREGVEAFASPRLMLNHFVQYTKGRLLGSVSGQYVSRMFLDNTADPALATRPYYLLGAQAGVCLGRAYVTVTVTNLLGARHYLPGGVSAGMPAVYPGALTAAFAAMKFSL
jgi:hypothetical protein